MRPTHKKTNCLPKRIKAVSINIKIIKDNLPILIIISVNCSPEALSADIFVALGKKTLDMADEKAP